jgi:serine O-acetyltransferase
MSYLIYDIRRYTTLLEKKNIFSVLYLFAFSPGLWVIVSYRFGRWIRIRFKVPVLQQLLKLISLLGHFFLSLISHFGGIVINPNVVIGDYCNMGEGNVIGQAGRRGEKGSPVIGDYVFIGSGAKIIGKIKVGNNVAIGANAVVVRDVPDNATVVGVPARVINYKGSADFIRL